MPTIQYTFTSTTTSFQAGSPLTLVLQPSGINPSGKFINKMIYQFPDKTITRVYTYATLTDALTIYKDIDVRAPVIYTFPGNDISPDDSSVFAAKVSAFENPGGAVTVYTVSANIILQHFTKNPIQPPSYPYIFDEVHLVKTRVWGPNDSQLYVLETKNPHYLLLNLDQGNEPGS